MATASTALLHRARRRCIVAAVALTGVASLGTAWVGSIQLWPANAPAVVRHGNAAGTAAPTQPASGTLRVGVEQAAGLATARPASAARDDMPGSAADTECRSGISVLTRLRAAAAALLPHDGLLVPLIGRIERAEDEAARAGMELHAAAVTRLRSSADPLQRAAGLAVAPQPRPVRVAARPELAESGAAAQPEAAASQPLDPLQDDVQALADLALLARDVADPRIYAWAWTACKRMPHERLPAACGQLSAQRWAQLAPAHAAPWLALATQTRLQADVAGEWNAMHRAALATQWRPPAADLLPLLLAAQAAVPVASAHVRLNAEWQALLLRHRAADPPSLAFCQQTIDANRHSLCSQLAERLLAGADDLLQFSVGVGLAERLAWPATRLAALRAERQQLRDAASQSDALQLVFASDAGTACGGIAALRRRIARIAADGELADLRDAARAGALSNPASPRPPPPLAP